MNFNPRHPCFLNQETLQSKGFQMYIDNQSIAMLGFHCLFD